MKKMTPVLVVDAIEPCVDFWSRLGLATTVEVPHDDKLGFVILAGNGVELMYQSRASVADDIPALAAETYRTALFVEVESLDATITALEGVEEAVPERETFYGFRELGVRDPAGNLVIFAQQLERAQS